MPDQEVCYDDVLESVGGFGRFQKVQFVLLNMVALIGACHAFNMVFNGATPEHHCQLDSAMVSHCNMSYSNLRDFSIPQQYDRDAAKLVWGQCSMRSASNYTEDCTFPTVTANNSNSFPTTGCVNGWAYSSEYYKNTIVTEWDLVCTQEWKRSMTDTMFFAGRLFGAILFGHLADRYGRKRILLVAAVLQATFGVVTAVIPSFIPFVILFFLQGAVQCGTFILAFVYVTEIVSPSKRKIAAMANRYFYCLGQIVLAGVAALLRDWRGIELAISLPGFFFISYIWFVPESGRWLISTGKHDEAVLVVEKIAAINGLPDVPVKALMKSSMAKKSSTKQPHAVQESGIRDLFRTCILARISLITWFLWFVNSTIYVGLALHTRNLAGNPYLNFLMAAMVELPALTLALLLIDRIGRKVCAVCFLAIAALSCFAAAFVPNGVLDTVLVMVAKFGISGSFAIVMLMSAELFPTSVRNMAMGVSAMCGHIGGTTAPLLLATWQVFRPLPMLVFGGLCLIAALAVLFVPEMLGCPLPQTVGDLMNNMRRINQKSILKGEEAVEAVPEISIDETQFNTGIANPIFDTQKQRTGHMQKT